MLWKPRHFGSLASPAMRLSLWASHSLTAGRSVVFLFSTVSSPVSPPHRSVCDLSPPYFHTAIKVRQQSPSVKTTNITNHCSPSLFLFIPLFPHLWNKLPHSVQSHCSLQAFKTAVHHHILSTYRPQSKPSIFSTPVNAPQTHLLQIPSFPSRKSL